MAFQNITQIMTEMNLSVEGMVDYDPETGALRVQNPKLGTIAAWDRDVVDSGALVRRLPVGSVVVEVDQQGGAVEASARRLLAVGVLERVGDPWATYGGKRWVEARVAAA